MNTLSSLDVVILFFTCRRGRVIFGAREDRRVREEENMEIHKYASVTGTCSYDKTTKTLYVSPGNRHPVRLYFPSDRRSRAEDGGNWVHICQCNDRRGLHLHYPSHAICSEKDSLSPHHRRFLLFHV